MSNAELLVFKEKLFKAALAFGFTDCEIYFRAGRSFESHIFKGEVTEYKNASFSGISFRGTYNGKMGYAYSESMDDSVIETLVKNAAGNAEIIEDTDIEELYRGDENYESVHTYFDELNDISVEEKIKAAIEMEKAAYEADVRVKNVVHCVVGTGEDEVIIANNYGLELAHKRNFALAYVYPSVEENSSVKMSGDIWYGNNWNEFLPKELAASAVKRSLSYLNAKPVPSKTYSVVFSNEMTRDILNVFSPVFFAEQVQKGFSLLKDKLGKQIASEILTIKDDGICEKSMGKLAFDSEGVATQNKAVIEGGKLMTYLYTTKSAKKDNVASTGNGFKGGIHGSIATACTNFYIEPTSELSQDELLKEMSNGLLITELEGMHSGTNVISGDFSWSASGFLIENGTKIHAVEQITVAGNFYEWLNNITVVGNDLKFDMPSRTGTIGAPSVLVKSIDVSGI